MVGVSYTVVAFSLIGLVGDSLFKERRKQDQASALRLADDAAILFEHSENEVVSLLLQEAEEELNARIQICDLNGKVQFDSRKLSNGTLLKLPEVARVLRGETETAYGLHTQEGTALQFWLMGFLGGEIPECSSCCVCLLQGENGPLGVLVYVVSTQEMLESIFSLWQRITLYFLAAAVGSILFALLISLILTRPVKDLTRGIRRMEHGDFSVRVKVKGSGELRQMSEAFNIMSEKLEMLDKSRNQFVSNASHELKTPLATMKILLESIIYQPDMEEGLRTEFLTDINKEIDRLNSVIGDLLTLVSMDSKTLRLNRTNFSLSQLVSETAARLDLMVKQRRQELILQLGDRCDLYADSGKLTQVVYNLLENASKYTQEGGVIKVRLIRSGHDAILSVTDNGPGIPKEDQAHIFDRFYRVDKARSRETGGTGLGLSIVHQMVLMHGGTVSVESEEGKGSTFTVELPVYQG